MSIQVMTQTEINNLFQFDWIVEEIDLTAEDIAHIQATAYDVHPLIKF